MPNNETRPACCGRPMAKYGLAWSGRKRVQRFRCSQCGATKYDTKKEGGK